MTNNEELLVEATAAYRETVEAETRADQEHTQAIIEQNKAADQLRAATTAKKNALAKVNALVEAIAHPEPEPKPEPWTSGGAEGTNR